MAELDGFLGRGLAAAAAAAAALATPERASALSDAVTLVEETLRGGGTLLLFGNGGSAADASHLAGEFVGRCVRDRGALPAIALGDAAATVTALANDFGYDQVYSRTVAALGRPGDLAWALSTSGRSPNVLEGLRTARERGLRTLGMTGSDGGAMSDLCDVLLLAPSSDTPRVQECHQVWGHLIAEWVDSQPWG